ncbi:MFS transporter [Actinoplanes sp. CA-142083]|uniref:MFS transporter n=1 Tax=Actinoplanes sp. CA-142083 TaxID=3239903 RepID=UPI003D8E907F
MAAGCAFQFGLPFLIPALRDEGLSLAQAGLLTSAPAAGLLATLIAWGAAADRWGERGVLTTGLAATGLILPAAALVHGTAPLTVCFFLAGATSAAVNASSGRLILGWFVARERGRAMAMRQATLPIGVGFAALTLPSMSRPAALVMLGLIALAAAAVVAVVVRDPPPAEESKPANAAGPYRTPILWRIHAASSLLIVPQVTVGTFALVFLVDAHGWTASAAGRLLAASQAGGALARLVAGWWSDRVGLRLRPARRISVAITAAVALLAAAAPASGPAGEAAAVTALLAAAVLTVSPNGLAYTAVAEHAGPAWAGRALGIQNTAQNVVAIATAPVMATVIAAADYRAAFAAAAVFPLAAAAVLPMGR